MTIATVSAKSSAIKEKEKLAKNGQIEDAKEGATNEENGNYWEEFGEGDYASKNGFPQIY